MNFKWMIIWLILILVAIGVMIYFKIPQCSVMQTINASVEVKAIPSRILLGMNADKDSLKFGVVSPGTEVVRSVNTQYVRNASVRVWPQGSFAEWMSIDQAEFSLASKENRQVMFHVNVPLDATSGNYTGKVVFCFKDVRN